MNADKSTKCNLCCMGYTETIVKWNKWTYKAQIMSSVAIYFYRTVNSRISPFANNNLNVFQ